MIRRGASKRGFEEVKHHKLIKALIRRENTRENESTSVSRSLHCAKKSRDRERIPQTAMANDIDLQPDLSTIYKKRVTIMRYA